MGGPDTLGPDDLAKRGAADAVDAHFIGHALARLGRERTLCRRPLQTKSKAIQYSACNTDMDAAMLGLPGSSYVHKNFATFEAEYNPAQADAGQELDVQMRVSV